MTGNDSLELLHVEGGKGGGKCVRMIVDLSLSVGRDYIVNLETSFSTYIYFTAPFQNVTPTRCHNLGHSAHVKFNTGTSGAACLFARHFLRVPPLDK